MGLVKVTGSVAEYRRLQTITGADYASVVAARAELLQFTSMRITAIWAMNSSDICGSHADYLWDIIHEAS